MKRNVFIIGAPLSTSNPRFYNGVIQDVRNFYKFFTSPMGGGFFYNEIHILINQNWSSIVTTMLCNPADYSIIVFSGHGYVGVPSMETKLKLNDYQFPSVSDFSQMNHAPKQLFLVDVCRDLMVDYFEASGFLGDPATADMEFPSNTDIFSARQSIETWVSSANYGVQVIYSCAVNQRSGITARGSYFSNALLQSVKSWANHRDTSNVLLGAGAHKYASLKLTNDNIRQNPKIEFHQGANFPFAVKQPIRQYGFVNDFW